MTDRTKLEWDAKLYFFKITNIQVYTFGLNFTCRIVSFTVEKFYFQNDLFLMMTSGGEFCAHCSVSVST